MTLASLFSNTINQEYEPFHIVSEKTFVKSLDRDFLFNCLFKEIGRQAIYRLSQTDKQWNHLISIYLHSERLKIYSKSFNPEDWKETFEGFHVNDEEIRQAFHSLPINIDTDESFLTWHPKISLLEFNQLLKKISLESTMQFTYDSSKYLNSVENKKIEKPYWIIIQKESLKMKTFSRILEIYLLMISILLKRKDISLNNVELFSEESIGFPKREGQAFYDIVGQESPILVIEPFSQPVMKKVKDLNQTFLGLKMTKDGICIVTK